MRTFVAIELGEACRAALADAADRLRSTVGGVRWVRVESLHLTLKFVGELAESDLPAAAQVLDDAAAAVQPFTMQVCGLSGFPPRGVPRVIHVGAEEPTGALSELQRRVEEGLERGLGIAREKRRYVPHLTLGRVKDRRRCPSMQEIAALVPDQEFGRVEVDCIVLMKSDLRPSGAVYTPLQRFPLVR